MTARGRAPQAGRPTPASAQLHLFGMLAFHLLSPHLGTCSCGQLLLVQTNIPQVSIVGDHALAPEEEQTRGARFASHSPQGIRGGLQLRVTLPLSASAATFCSVRPQLKCCHGPWQGSSVGYSQRGIPLQEATGFTARLPGQRYS